MTPEQERVLAHHEEDEANEEFQDALHELADRCSACGQPLPKEEPENAP